MGRYRAGHKEGRWWTYSTGCNGGYWTCGLLTDHGRRWADEAYKMSERSERKYCHLQKWRGTCLLEDKSEYGKICRTDCYSHNLIRAQEEDVNQGHDLSPRLCDAV